MQRETILSSYILRLSRKHQRLRVGLQDVRTGHTEDFDSIEALIEHLGHLQTSLELKLITDDAARAPPVIPKLKRNTASIEPLITPEFESLESVYNQLLVQKKRCTAGTKSV
jgi:hypothetical protein